MATMNNGPFGIISGKIGNLIGYNYHGTQRFRAMPKKSTKPPTIAQQAQRMRFGLVCHFLNPLTPLISKGYGNSQGRSPRKAQCVAYHTKHAVKGIFPDAEIDYSAVVLTTGRLDGVHDGEVWSDDVGRINIKWNERFQCLTSSEMDQVILIVYNPVKDIHQLLMSFSDRLSKSAVLAVPKEFLGDTVHCWMTFVSPCGKQFSTSSYLGVVTIGA